MLRLASELTTRLLQPAHKSALPTSEVLLNGAPTGKFISGAVMEAKVAWDERYLLFMTDDTPFEEVLSVHLLDRQFNILDSAQIGGPYATGSFSSLQLQQPNVVHFRFIGDTNWSIELLAARAFRLPFLSEPPGVRRSVGFGRSFIVHGHPLAAKDRA